MRIQSSSRTVVTSLRTIEATVRDAGATIHPALTVNHEGSQLWLSLPREENRFAGEAQDRPHADSAEVLRVPTALNVPVTHLDWEAPGGFLEYSGDTERLSAAQRTILDAMVDLFNACDKVRLVGEQYPQAMLAADSELSALIEEARPGYQRVGSTSPAGLVVRSRLLREMGEGEEGPQGVFMPLIDMLNHHPYGSPFGRDAGDLVIRAHHPTPTDQLFARYNKADAFGIALGLGYVEQATRFVASAAGQVQVAGLGAVHILGVGVHRTWLPAPRVRQQDDGSLALAGLMLQPGRMAVLRQLLAMPLASLTGQPLADCSPLATDLLAAVLDRNVAVFTMMKDLCARPGGSPRMRELFGRVAEHQLRLVDACRADLRTIDLTDTAVRVG